MKNINRISSVLFGGLLIVSASCNRDNDEPQPANETIIVQANGDITPKLNEFRQLLGAELNTTPGATGGRREINWDGVPEDLLGQKLPDNFFNPTDPGSNASNQRGFVYSPVGNFQVSKTNFAEVNDKAADQFAAFSGNKTFTNTNTNLWDVEFQVAGQAVAAKVKGFGAVFSDVDVANKTFLEFFSENQSLGKFFVPVHNANSSFSFLGVYFKNKSITRIRVGHDGTLSDGQEDISEGGTKDLVVMDDFLYNEPVKQ